MQEIASNEFGGKYSPAYFQVKKRKVVVINGSYLDAETLLRCGAVCTCWNEISNIRSLWEKYKYSKDASIDLDPKLLYILKTMYF